MSKRKTNKASVETANWARAVAAANMAATKNKTDGEKAATAVAKGESEPSKTTSFGVVLVAVALLVMLIFGVKATMLSGEGLVAVADDTTNTAAQTETAGTAAMLPISQDLLSQATPKEEMVYAMLQSDGKPYLGYAINHYVSLEEREIVDFGNYSSLKNLTSTSAISASDGRINTMVGAGDFYYQGTLENSELPWLVDVVWQLDGIQMPAQDIVGKSGKLEIKINVNPNSAADPVYFKNYLLQTQIQLSSEVAKNIEFSNGSKATVGKNEQCIFIVMPNRADEFWLKADVTNFEMTGIQFLGLPFSTYIDMPNTSGIVNNMVELSTAIDKLDQSINTLAEGSSQLAGGNESLDSGSAEINKNIIQLSDNGALLSTSSAEIDESLLSISEQLSAGTSASQDTAELVVGLRNLAKALDSSDPAAPGMVQALQNISAGVGSATTTLDQAIGALEVVPAEQIAAISSDPAMAYTQTGTQTTISALIALNGQAAYLKAIWAGTPEAAGISAALSSAQSGLDLNVIPSCITMSDQLDAMATSLEEGTSSIDDLVVLSGYLQQLSTEYSSFNGSLAKYSQSVEKLSGSYKTFDAGLSEHTDGSNELDENLHQLQEGSNDLDSSAEGMPQTTREQIDAAYAEYQPQPFELKSFVCPENKAVERVQFVMMSDALKLPDAATEASVEDTPGFWGRLFALFGV